MKYLIYFLILLFPFGQLLRLPLSGNEAVLHANDVVVGVIALVWAVRQVWARKKYKEGVLRAATIWMGIALISLTLNTSQFSPREIIISSLYLWRFVTYFILYMVVGEFGKSESQKVQRLMLLSILVVAIAGLLQYIFLPNVAFLAADNWDDHYYRLISTFLDPGFTGAILVLGLVFAWEKLSAGLSKWAYLATVYVAMALTYSRAAFLSFLVAAGIISIYRKSAKLVLGCIVLLAVTIAVLPTSTGEGTKLNRENSILARLHNWEQSLKLWPKKPLLGTGFNTYRYVVGVSPQSHAGSADSSMLLVLVTTGIVGFLAYLNLGREIFRTNQKSVLVVASFAGIIVNSWFNNTLFYPWVMEWLWILVAVSSAS